MSCTRRLLPGGHVNPAYTHTHTHTHIHTYDTYIHTYIHVEREMGGRERMSERE